MDTHMIKKILIAAVVIIVLAVTVILYWTRNQEIRFVGNFPDAFEYYIEGGNAYIASEGSVKDRKSTRLNSSH